MTKYCNKCNAVVEEIGNFCTQCGSNDIRDDQNPTPVETTPVATEEVVEQAPTETQPMPETIPEVTDNNVISNSNPINIPTAVQEFDHAATSTPVDQNENSFANVPDFMYGNEEQQQEQVIEPVRHKLQPNVMPQQMPSQMRSQVNKKPKTNIPIFAAIGAVAFILIIGIVFIFTNNNKKEDLEQVPVIPFSENDLSVSGNNNDSFDTSTIFTKENSFRVGEEAYGFISIPKSWTYFTDRENPSKSLQFTDNGTWIVTLYGKPTSQENAVDWANSVYLTITQSGAQNVSTSQTVIDGYTALSISAYYQNEKKYLTTWFLETKNGITHYLAIEGPTSTNENYNIIYSFNENK